MIIKYKSMIPTIFGVGAISQLGDEVKLLGCNRPLCVYDRGIKAAGIAGKAEAALNAAGLDCRTFDTVTADPASDLIDDIVEMARAEAADCVIGVGGGSSMDAAKAASIMMGLDGNCRDYLRPEPQFFRASVPIVLVPTTSGSGSEASDACVITHDRLGTKVPIHVESSLALVDPDLVRTLPASATAETGMDALSHAVETFTSKDSTPRTELLALGAVRRIARSLPVACHDGANIEARTEMAYASNWAGFTTVDATLHIGHCIADAFSRAFPLPHGLPCAWATPEVLDLVAPVVPDKVRMIGEEMGIEFGATDSPSEIGAKAADGVRRLMKAANIKSAAEAGVDRERAVSYSRAVMELGLRFFCPVEITPDLAAELVARTYDNYS